MNSWGFLCFWKEQQQHTKFSFLLLFIVFITGTSPGGTTMFYNSRSPESNKGIIHGGKDLLNLNTSCEFIKDVLKSVTFGKH